MGNHEWAAVVGSRAESYWRARNANGRGYEVHDRAAMGDVQRAEFINKLDFPEWEKQPRPHIQRSDGAGQPYAPWSENRTQSECRLWGVEP